MRRTEETGMLRKMLVSAVLSFFAMTGAVLATDATFREMDRDNDGKLSREGFVN